MLKFLFTFILVFIAACSIYINYNAENTFQAKFKNIDGLPKGAPVTALGVQIGKVLKTKPQPDGVLVTVKITNKSFTMPPPGSQITITSLRPGQGRVLEIIPPDKLLSDNKSWVFQEPVTTTSWLNAGLEICNGIESFSSFILDKTTPENINKTRTTLKGASEILKNAVSQFTIYEENLSKVRDRLANNSEETSLLLIKLNKPINSLNNIVKDKEVISSLKNKLSSFTEDVKEISGNINNPNVVSDVISFKQNILDHLNQVNQSLTEVKQSTSDPLLKQKIINFNSQITELNEFYEQLNKKDIGKITKTALKKAKKLTTEAAELTKHN